MHATGSCAPPEATAARSGRAWDDPDRGKRAEVEVKDLVNRFEGSYRECSATIAWSEADPNRVRPVDHDEVGRKGIASAPVEDRRREVIPAPTSDGSWIRLMLAP